MISLPLVESCRLSGESLRDAKVLFEVENCPLPGIYPESPDDAAEMTSPLRIVQARQSRFVQLAHSFDEGLYRDYAFSGGGAGAYRRHLGWFADDIVSHFPKSSSVLEVGCGDGWLIRELRRRGYSDVFGIDPSRAASNEACSWLIRGYFPSDLPSNQRNRQRDLVVCRHVLEHIEKPVPFMRVLAETLKPEGELWIEVPDLDCTLERGIWSNFYQLHCNYFSAASLDRLAAEVGLICAGGQVVEVFGGSILRRYRLGTPAATESVAALAGVEALVKNYQNCLTHLAHKMPEDSVGYGAAERTAVTLGLAPVFMHTLTGLFDGNTLIQGRYFAGTELKIGGRKDLRRRRPRGVVLFAISNAAEIIGELKQHLDGETVIGVAGGDFLVAALNSYK